MDRAADFARLVLPFALGIGLAAAQLLPTLELTRLGFRSGGLDFKDAAAFSFPPWLALQGLLPTVGQDSLFSEWIAYVSLSALALAVVGLLAGPPRVARWLGVAAALSLFLAFGEFTPIYRIAYLLVPGMDLFRVPARWLATWSLAVALLAALGTDAVLFQRGWLGRIGSIVDPWLRVARRHWRVGVPLLALVATGALAIAYELRHYRRIVGLPSLESLALWAVSLCALAAIIRLKRQAPRGAVALLVLLVAAELYLGSLNAPFQLAAWPTAVEAVEPPVAALQSAQQQAGWANTGRALSASDNTWDPGDLAKIRSMLKGTLPDGAIPEYVSALKRVEDLTPNVAMQFGLRSIDGYDGGLLPLAGYPALKQLFPVQGQNLPDGRLDLQLHFAPDPRLLAWLNVEYFLIDRIRDQWVNGIYYDLAISTPLPAATDLRLPAQPAPATAVGVIIRADPAATGTLSVTTGGRSIDVPLAPSKPLGAPIQLADGESGSLAVLPLGQPITAGDVTLRWTGTGNAILRAMSLIDQRDNASEVVVASPDYELFYLGDVKIYRDKLTLPHAFLARGLTALPDADAVQSALRAPVWDATSAALVSDPSASPGWTGSPLNGDRATIVDDRPGSIALNVRATDRRVVVFDEFAYPGWVARVDGAIVPDLRVDGFFQGVEVGPGQHRVSFTYEPSPWRLGMIFSGAAVVLWLLGLATAFITDQNNSRRADRA